MPRFFFILLAWLAVLAAPAIAGAQSPLRLLVFGDSLVAGYGLPQGKGFPEELGRTLGDAVAVSNAGISGETTAGGAARIEWALGGDSAPDAVIVVLGGNDALRGLPPDDMARNLDTILAAIQGRGIPVLLAGMKAPLNLGADYAAAFDAAFTDALTAAIARVEADSGAGAVIYYPFFLEGVALQPALNQADGIHPNEAGVAEITKRILPQVRELLALAEKEKTR